MFLDILNNTLAFLQDPQTWKYAILAIIPIWAYAWFFYQKSPRPRPKLLYLLTFWAGCFSVAPLLIYQYFYLNLESFAQAELNQLIGNIALESLLNGLLSYVLHIAFITILIFVIALLTTVITTCFSPKTFRNIFRSILEENFNFQFIATIIGILVALNALLGSFFNLNIFHQILGIIMLKAMMEEYSKHLIVRFTDDDQLNNIDDAIGLSLFVWLSFAFVENILYFSHSPDQLLTLFIGRSLVTVLAHVAFSGIFGYYYGISHFASPLFYEKDVVWGKRSVFLRIMAKIFRLKPDNIFREVMILNWLFISTVLHTIFNFLLSQGITQIAFLLVGAMIYYLLNLLQAKENYRQLGLIGTHIMPEKDFRNLKWQIESLRWAKEIKAKQNKQKPQPQPLPLEQPKPKTATPWDIR